MLRRLQLGQLSRSVRRSMPSTGCNCRYRSRQEWRWEKSLGPSSPSQALKSPAVALRLEKRHLFAMVRAVACSRAKSMKRVPKYVRTAGGGRKQIYETKMLFQAHVAAAAPRFPSSFHARYRVKMRTTWAILAVVCVQALISVSGATLGAGTCSAGVDGADFYSSVATTPGAPDVASLRGKVPVLGELAWHVLEHENRDAVCVRPTGRAGRECRVPLWVHGHPLQGAEQASTGAPSEGA